MTFFPSFSFSTDAQEVLDEISDEITARARMDPRSSCHIPEIVTGIGQKRYFDHIVRCSTVMHVITWALRSQRDGIELTCPTEIHLSTLTQAKEFVDHTCLVKSILFSVSKMFLFILNVMGYIKAVCYRH